MLLRIDGPVLGHRAGDIITIDDEQGKQIVEDYGTYVTLLSGADEIAPASEEPPAGNAQDEAKQPSITVVEDGPQEAPAKPRR